jgi:hypothetical protein
MQPRRLLALLLLLLLLCCLPAGAPVALHILL